MHGSELDWPHVLLTWVAGLRGQGLVRALLSQRRPSVGKDRAHVHVHMEGACILTALVDALLSTPLCHFLKLDVKPARESLSWPRRSPCVATGVQKTNCSVVARSSQRGASGSSATLPSATISKTPASQCGSRAITWSHLLFRLSGTIKEIASFMCGENFNMLFRSSVERHRSRMDVSAFRHSFHTML